ncbi:porin family protein [Tunicatimonas pelagia]|uniref:porin family protein n=1 Tax=Tunicatimonas pelagia TaxID=931531 RepID=UPI002665CD39|nr:porin family protein [Tunicatimonas pelagia]WKN43544.1 porin family protein [Tunicatimonas pelagia]
MKKYIVLAYAIFLGTSVLAQEVRIGVRGGFGLANQRVERGLLLDTKSRFSWQIGGEANIAVDDMIAIHPALVLSSRGTRIKGSDFGVDYHIRYRPLYLHVPIPVVARMDIGGMDVFGGLGPYFSLGLGGQIVADGGVLGLGVNGDTSIDWGNDNSDNFRSLDAGLVFTAGVVWNGLQFALAYDLGLANIAPNGDDDNIVRNRVFTLTTTYFLPN